MIDLHCHSTASDGAVAPSDLPRLARDMGLSALALTDHDTTSGLADFLKASEQIGFNGIPGVELSVIENNLQCHIIGLYVQPDCEELQEKLAQIVVWRNERNLKILDALHGMDVNLTMDDVLACCVDDQIIGRPHFAKALVKLGYCNSEEGAFKKFLRRGAPAYFPRQTLGLKETIDLLHKSCALTFWAHPMTSTKMTNVGLSKTLDMMKEIGLDGIEAFYPSYTTNQTKTILRLAKEKDLLISGGTDYHGGGAHLGVDLGIGYGGDFMIKDDVLDAIQPKRYRPFVFIDRDDTLIYDDKPYRSDPTGMRLIPGCCEAIRRFWQAGFKVAMVSNQAGIGRGIVSYEQFTIVQMHLAELLAEGGAGLDAVYYCPHKADDKCRCRKPATGMLEQACTENHVDVRHSFLIGDAITDIKMGHDFGLKTVQLIAPGVARDDAHADFTATTLTEAADWILSK